MSEDLITIACPTYNHEEYIRQCLDSLLMQKTTFSFKILIHDDASTDSTPNIISDYHKRYPHIIIPIFQKINQHSLGIKNASIILPMIKTKYIALCEGDDYWIDPFKLQKQVDFLEKNNDYIIHSGSAKIIRDNLMTDEIIGAHDFTPKTFQLEDFLHQNNLVTCTVLFRNIINKNDLDFFRNVVFGDWYLYVLLLNKSQKKAYRSKDILSVYRIHDKGVHGGMSLLVNYNTYINQILIIKETIKYKGTSKLVLDSLNFYCFEKFKILYNEKQYISSFKTFVYNFYLSGFKMSLKKYFKVFFKL